MIEDEGIRDEAVGYLQQLLRLNTVNPPGNEIIACEYLSAVLAQNGIESTVLESAPTRGNIVARLKGDGRAKPLLMMVHLDVVPTHHAVVRQVLVGIGQRTRDDCNRCRGTHHNEAHSGFAVGAGFGHGCNSVNGGTRQCSSVRVSRLSTPCKVL